MPTGSILNDTKKVLGLEADYTAFDLDIMIHINSVFATLQQLGIGPIEGFEITGENETWDSFLNGDKRLNPVKTYLYLRVRRLFDPPTTGYHMTAVDEQIKELEWRLNVYRENRVFSAPPSTSNIEITLDGGSP